MSTVIDKYYLTGPSLEVRQFLIFSLDQSNGIMYNLINYTHLCQPSLIMSPADINNDSINNIFGRSGGPIVFTIKSLTPGVYIMSYYDGTKNINVSVDKDNTLIAGSDSPAHLILENEEYSSDFIFAGTVYSFKGVSIKSAIGKPDTDKGPYGSFTDIVMDSSTDDIKEGPLMTDFHFVPIEWYFDKLSQQHGNSITDINTYLPCFNAPTYRCQNNLSCSASDAILAAWYAEMTWFANTYVDKLPPANLSFDSVTKYKGNTLYITGLTSEILCTRNHKIENCTIDKICGDGADSSTGDIGCLGICADPIKECTLIPKLNRLVCLNSNESKAVTFLDSPIGIALLAFVGLVIVILIIAAIFIVRFAL